MTRAETRRRFLRATGGAASASLLRSAPAATSPNAHNVREGQDGSSVKPDYTLVIAVKPIEIAPKRILSLTTYNGQFPGPLLRVKEGQQITVDIQNETDTPEQLHWHGQLVATDVDGAAEEGTPFIPAHASRRISFIPKPSGFRFYHTHVHAGADLSAGQYGGQVGPIYIEPKDNPGRYDREVFLTLKEFEPTFSRGGDMASDFLSPSATVESLKEKGESAMKTSLARGMPHGFEVGYNSFTINGRMLGHGEPIRVKQGERVLFHVLNGSATEIRSLALPGHEFTVIAMDGNALAKPVRAPGLWLGTAERISAIVEMNHPGVWIMGDLADDDRHHGMGAVVEYAGHRGKPQWITPRPFRWNYAHFKNAVPGQEPEQTFEMRFAKENAAESGFNRWAINGVAYPNTQMQMKPMFRVQRGKRYRIRMRNESDDIHPIHLHRHTFELTRIAGQPAGGVMKDVVMVDGYQEAEIDFVADNPGLTLFPCHQQLHMDFCFMTLFEYV